MVGTEDGRPYLFDSSSLIELERNKELRLLSYTDVRIPSKVAEEVNKPRSDLAGWLAENRRLVTHMLSTEGRTYMRLIVSSTPSIDDGEAVAIAIAHHRRLTLVIEDGAGRTVAESLGVRCINVDEFRRRVAML